MWRRIFSRKDLFVFKISSLIAAVNDKQTFDSLVSNTRFLLSSKRTGRHWFHNQTATRTHAYVNCEGYQEGYHEKHWLCWFRIHWLHPRDRQKPTNSILESRIEIITCAIVKTRSFSSLRYIWQLMLALFVYRHEWVFDQLRGKILSAVYRFSHWWF